MTSRKNHRLTFFKCILLVASLVFPLALVEVAFRLHMYGFSERVLHFPNIAYRGRPFLTSNSYPIEIDGQLGWVPKPGTNGQLPIWKKTVTINSNGIRENGLNESPRYPHSILAVGDSFTFGDNVNDNETWPSFVEQIVRLGVVNGGVPAYGIDQMYLRSQHLIELYNPKLVLLSLIADDIIRVGQRVRNGLPKPYFIFQGGNLQLVKTNLVQIQEHLDKVSQARSRDMVKYLFGWSIALDRFMKALAPDYWIAGAANVPADNEPVSVSCKLILNLREHLFARHIGFRTILQYRAAPIMNKPQINESQFIDFTSCLLKNNVDVIDTRPRLSQLYANTPERFVQTYYTPDAHMSSVGNRAVAQIIVDDLRVRPTKNMRIIDGTSIEFIEGEL